MCQKTKDICLFYLTDGVI